MCIETIEDIINAK